MDPFAYNFLFSEKQRYDNLLKLTISGNQIPGPFQHLNAIFMDLFKREFLYYEKHMRMF
jgi:hypothetical protein